ncbi:malonate decarboxylase holo-ACP synthase [Celerinatantimonas yamalensis]|uniref:Malonate decarboxylase holo-ACP synthase n=1 Tax=Celerinatantimonas yamalensis TaxID=559956 RepID=A0ABW9G4P9_9GAMM
MPRYAPHDLVWIESADALSFDSNLPQWVRQAWQCDKPLVIRRDINPTGKIAAGIRGKLRSQRYACWIDTDAIIDVLSPETLIEQRYWQRYEWNDVPVIESLIALSTMHWPLPWGVTGSCAYSLASHEMVMRAESDLDLRIVTPTEPDLSQFSELLALIKTLKVRVDIQLETPAGGVALNEWIKRANQLLVKSAHGPFLSPNPWTTHPQEAQ